LDKDSSHIEDFNNFVSQELIKPESNSSSALAANREDQEEVARLVARINQLKLQEVRKGLTRAQIEERDTYLK